MRTPKVVKIKYEVVVATFDPQGLIGAQERLYELFDQAFYTSASDVVGVDFLIDTTELIMSGETG